MLPNYKKALKFKNLKDDFGNNIGSIGSIYITGGRFERKEFKGISPDSQFGWEELVWKKTPTRGGGFAMTNIYNIEIGKVPRLEIVFKYIDMEDYIALREILNSERFVYVEYFNMDTGRWVSREMYCTESSKSRFFMLNKSLIGTIDCSLKFVGTNNDLDVIIGSDETESYSLKKYKITYNMNGYGNAPSSDERTYASILQLPTPNIVNPPADKTFYWLVRDIYGNIFGKYSPNRIITIFNDMEFEAYFE